MWVKKYRKNTFCDILNIYIYIYSFQFYLFCFLYREKWNHKFINHEIKQTSPKPQPHFQATCGAHKQPPHISILSAWGNWTLTLQKNKKKQNTHQRTKPYPTPPVSDKSWCTEPHIILLHHTKKKKFNSKFALLFYHTTPRPQSKIS